MNTIEKKHTYPHTHVLTLYHRLRVELCYLRTSYSHSLPPSTCRAVLPAIIVFSPSTTVYVSSCVTCDHRILTLRHRLRVELCYLRSSYSHPLPPSTCRAVLPVIIVFSLSTTVYVSSCVTCDHRILTLRHRLRVELRYLRSSYSHSLPPSTCRAVLPTIIVFSLSTTVYVSSCVTCDHRILTLRHRLRVELRYLRSSYSHSLSPSTCRAVLPAVIVFSLSTTVYVSSCVTCDHRILTLYHRLRVELCYLRSSYSHSLPPSTCRAVLPAIIVFSRSTTVYVSSCVTCDHRILTLYHRLRVELCYLRSSYSHSLPPSTCRAVLPAIIVFSPSTTVYVSSCVTCDHRILTLYHRLRVELCYLRSSYSHSLPPSTCRAVLPANIVFSLSTTVYVSSCVTCDHRILTLYHRLRVELCYLRSSYSHPLPPSTCRAVLPAIIVFSPSTTVYVSSCVTCDHRILTLYHRLRVELCYLRSSYSHSLPPSTCRAVLPANIVFSPSTTVYVSSCVTCEHRILTLYHRLRVELCYLRTSYSHSLPPSTCRAVLPAIIVFRDPIINRSRRPFNPRSNI